MESGDICPISHEPLSSYKPEDLLTLPCKHVFGRVDVIKSFYTNQSCPMCRNKVDTVWIRKVHPTFFVRKKRAPTEIIAFNHEQNIPASPQNSEEDIWDDFGFTQVSGGNIFQTDANGRMQTGEIAMYTDDDGITRQEIIMYDEDSDPESFEHDYPDDNNSDY